jgi:hypothetical protein
LISEQLPKDDNAALARYEIYKTCLRRLKAPTQQDLITLAEAVRRDPYNENVIIDNIRNCCKGLIFRPSRSKVTGVIFEELELKRKTRNDEVDPGDFLRMRASGKYCLHPERDAPALILKKELFGRTNKYEVFETVDPFKGKHYVIHRQGEPIRTTMPFLTLKDAIAAAERYANIKS